MSALYHHSQRIDSSFSEVTNHSTACQLCSHHQQIPRCGNFTIYSRPHLFYTDCTISSRKYPDHVQSAKRHMQSRCVRLWVFSHKSELHLPQSLPPLMLTLPAPSTWPYTEARHHQGIRLHIPVHGDASSSPRTVLQSGHTGILGYLSQVL